MAFRIVVVLVLSLAAAVAADAACLRCVGSEVRGTCEQSWDGYCSYPCCFMAEGESCWMGGETYECGPALMPAAYFGTKLPLVTEGSALRLQLGKGQPVRRSGKCAVVPPRRTA